MNTTEGGVSAMSAELGPVAWMFMQATYGEGDVRGRGWLPALKFTRPMWEVMQKDVQPLFTRAQLDAAVAAERERCAEVCETATFTGNTFPRTQMEQLRMDIAAAILGPNTALSGPPGR
jgi:hypothetical protein